MHKAQWQAAGNGADPAADGHQPAIRQRLEQAEKPERNPRGPVLRRE
jgi:hypothetical protein